MKRNDSMSIIVHDFAVVGPIPASNISLAKGLAAERARQVLEDPESPYYLPRICDCKEQAPLADLAFPDDLGDPEAGKKLDDETEQGFAALARAVLAEVEPAHDDLDNNSHEGSDDTVFDPDLDGEAIMDEDAPMDIDSEDSDKTMTNGFPAHN